MAVGVGVSEGGGGLVGVSVGGIYSVGVGVSGGGGDVGVGVSGGGGTGVKVTSGVSVGTFGTYNCCPAQIRSELPMQLAA